MSCDTCQIQNFKIRKRKKSFVDFFSDIYPEKKVAITKDIGINSVIVKTVTFIVTDNCNLRCTYCYQHNKNHKGAMTKETAKRAIDLLFEEYEKENGRYITKDNAQALIIDFIGGEPLLEIELIDWAVDYFRMTALEKNHPWALHHWISISTNGVLYDNPLVDKFITKNRDRISLTISMDGNKELHDSCRLFADGRPSYDIVSKNFIQNMQRFNLKETKLTLAPANIMHLFEAHKHMLELGVENLLSNTVYEEGWEAEHAVIMYDQMKQLADYIIENKLYETVDVALFDNIIGKPKEENDNNNWCGGTGSMLAFDSEGMVYPCLRYAPLSLPEDIAPIIIGDIENGIEVTKEQSETVTMLNGITRRSQSTDECFNCPIAQGCAWCSAYNYEVTGTPNKRVTYICIMHKARVLANAYYFNTLLNKVDPEGTYERFELNIPKEWALEVISEEEYNMLCELSK